MAKWLAFLLALNEQCMPLILDLLTQLCGDVATVDSNIREKHVSLLHIIRPMYQIILYKYYSFCQILSLPSRFVRYL